MATFSAVDVSAEGFRLIKSRPGTFVIWILYWLILAVGPMLAIFAAAAPKFLDLVQEMKSAHDMHDSQVVGDMINFELGLLPLIGPWSLWLLLVSVVFQAAIYRAVLEPAKRGFAYLRIGGDELRLIVVGLVLAILLGCLFTLAVFAGVALFAAGDGVPHPWRGWIEAIGVIALVLVCLVVPFRFLLAMPQTFAEKKIRIFESWGLTRGRFWKIVGIVLMLFVYLILIGIVTGVIRQVMFVGLGMSTGAFDHMSDFEHIGDDLRGGLSRMLAAFGPALIAVVIVQSIASTLLRVVATAPFARAYAEITGHGA
jgi:hypothetical protein